MMKNILKYIFICCAVLLSFDLSAQVRDYKETPDFDYEDYSSYMKYMIQPYNLMGQTLYLGKVNDTLLDYFFVVKLPKVITKGAPNDDTPKARRNIISSYTIDKKHIKGTPDYYELTRMSSEKLKSLEGEWFVVLDYVADQFAYNRIADAAEDRQDWTKLRHPFMKLLVGDTKDTVFYSYQNFYNEYHFPFTPMSYWNRNKNGYPVSKYSYDDLNLIHYDTNANYAIVPDQLIGQRLTLPIATDATLERLYNGVRIYNYDDDSRKYSFTEYPIAKGRRLEGQSFVVKGVAFDAESLTNVYLKLLIDGRRDTIFYKYPTKQERHLFPFVIDSYYNRIREEYKDREFTVRGDKFPLKVIDIRRKRPLTLHQGDVFHCLDVVVKDGKFQMLMRNEKGRKFYMPEDYNLGDYLSFSECLMDSRVEKYRKTFPLAYKAILNKELISGMTMDMVNLSWGKYEREVFTNFDGSDRHWFYVGNVYVIFRNNVMYRVAMIPKELR